MANRKRQKIIERLRKAIPDDFQCEPGCTDCCQNHAWSWQEWQPVEPKLKALSQQQKCPYALPAGCACYEQRPIICRLYGLVDSLEVYGMKMSFACPRGVQAKHTLNKTVCKKMFTDWMAVIHDEVRDQMNGGKDIHYAGPYGAFVRRS